MPLAATVLHLGSQHSISADRFYTVTVEVRTVRSLLRFLPPTVHIKVGGVELRSVLHRRRACHNVAIPAVGRELIAGITVSASVAVQTIRILRIDQKDSLGALMILSPHPDDAELAAGGLYMDRCRDVSIVTLSSGDRIDNISSQYVRGLDKNLVDASARKATIRSWNSVHTPSLVGVPVSRCVNLGLPDSYLMQIATGKVPPVAASRHKAICRSFNAVSMPGDDAKVPTHGATVGDLCHLIELWRPATLILMDPEIDVHRDHRASSLLVADALERCSHRPETVLLCSVHHRNRLLSHPGRAFDAGYTASEADRNDRFFAEVENYVHVLSDESIKRKALLLESMCELTHRRMRAANFFLSIIRLDFRFLWNSVGGDRHIYYNRFLRRTEFFRSVKTKHFIDAVRCHRSKFQ